MKKGWYCIICRQTYPSIEGEDKGKYYVPHKDCSEAMDRAIAEEAFKKGYKNWQEWAYKDPDAVFEWERQWTNQLVKH